jgi:hypothetical protein
MRMDAIFSSFRLRLIRSPELFLERFRKELVQSSGKFLGFIQFATPDRQYHPMHPFQLAFDAVITRHIRSEFCLPELFIRFRRRGAATSLMPMPKAAMHEDDFSTRSEN